MITPTGLFIVFEGIDGAGKTTQVATLAATLRAAGHTVLATREPTNSPWGQQIRHIATHGRQGITLDDELDLFINDRAHHVTTEILPALDAGHTVICDRYYYSTIAYQGALGADPSAVRARNAQFPTPHIVFYLTITPRQSLARIAANRPGGADAGFEKLEFLTRVKTNFDNLTDPNIITIDATLPPSEIAQIIHTEITRLLK